MNHEQAKEMLQLLKEQNEKLESLVIGLQQIADQRRERDQYPISVRVVSVDNERSRW